MDKKKFSLEDLKILHKVFNKINPKDYIDYSNSIMWNIKQGADESIGDFIDWIESRQGTKSFESFIELLNKMS